MRLTGASVVVEGRLDDLVDRVHDRFANRFYPNESTSIRMPLRQKTLTPLPRAEVFVTLPNSTDKYFGNIKSVKRKSAAGLLSRNEDTCHPLGTDLWISPEEVQERDPADDYEYTVQLFGQEQVDDSDFFKASEDAPEHWGSVTVVVGPDRIA